MVKLILALWLSMLKNSGHFEEVCTKNKACELNIAIILKSMVEMRWQFWKYDMDMQYGSIAVITTVMTKSMMWRILYTCNGFSGRSNDQIKSNKVRIILNHHPECSKTFFPHQSLTPIEIIPTPIISIHTRNLSCVIHSHPYMAYLDVHSLAVASCLGRSVLSKCAISGTSGSSGSGSVSKEQILSISLLIVNAILWWTFAVSEFIMIDDSIQSVKTWFIVVGMHFISLRYPWMSNTISNKKNKYTFSPPFDRSR